MLDAAEKARVPFAMKAAPIDLVTFENTKYFPSLDGVRAFCVLLVMFNHVHAAVPPWIVGWLGVDVFFVLSGFLITTLLLRERNRTDRVSLTGFYIRRIFRIIPVYLFTVLLYFVAVHATHDPVKTAQFNTALPWLLSFMQEYRPHTAGNVLGHAWTLAIEEKFYVFWPLLLIFLYPFRSRALALLAAIFLTILVGFPHTFARSYDGLLIGAVLAIALEAPTRWPLVKRLPAVPDWALCLLLATTYFLTDYYPRCVLLFSGAVALLIASLVLRTGTLRSLLEKPVFVFVGKRSYAIYLIHVLAIDSVEKLSARFLPPNAILLVGIAYLVSIAGASLIYVAIERPFMSFGRHLSKRYVAADRTRLAMN